MAQQPWWSLRGEERERLKAADEARLTKRRRAKEASQLAAEASKLHQVERSAETPDGIIELRSQSGLRAYRHGSVTRAFFDEATRRLAHLMCLDEDRRPLLRSVTPIVPTDGTYLRLLGRRSGHESRIVTPLVISFRSAVREVLTAEQNFNPPTKEPHNEQSAPLGIRREGTTVEIVGSAEARA